MAVVSPSSSQQSSDSWDQPDPSISARRRAPAQTLPVHDDWEDDDDEPQSELDNQRIWEDANAKASNPMPSVVLSPSASASHQVVSPPLGAFQPTMRILKRPSNSSSNSPTPPPSSSSESLKDREAKYQAARERIFGKEAHNGHGNTSSQSSGDKKERKQLTPQNVPTVAVVRNPRGPGESVDSESSIPRGFGGQRAKPPLDSRDSII